MSPLTLPTRTFLEDGTQTKITPRIKEVAGQFSTDKSLATVFAILRWLENNLNTETSAKNEVFRNRTAEQIITDGFITGCTDITLVFIAIARAKGLPTKYVEMLSRGWLTNGDGDTVQGHVIAEVCIEGSWYFVDPLHGYVGIKRPSGMVIYDKGLDSWDVGLTHRNWREKFLEFKTKWRKDEQKRRLA